MKALKWLIQRDPETDSSPLQWALIVVVVVVFGLMMADAWLDTI